MTEIAGNSGVASEWARCYCCGRDYPTASTVTFHDHPGEHVCVTCVRWLYTKSLPIARRQWLRRRLGRGRGDLGPRCG